MSEHITVDFAEGHVEHRRFTSYITWRPASGLFAGQTLKDGLVEEHPEHGTVVVFHRHANKEVFKRCKVKADKVSAVVKDKPGLAVMVDEVRRVDQERREVDRADSERRARLWQAAEAELAREVAALLVKMPTDHLRVLRPQIGDLDGDPIFAYIVVDGSPLGEEISWKDFQGADISMDDALVRHGVAVVDGGDTVGTLREFVLSISRGHFEAILERRRAKEEQAEAKKKAKEEEFQAKLAQAQARAKETGERQLLDQMSYHDPRPDIESDITIRTRYVTPDGRIVTEEGYAH